MAPKHADERRSFLKVILALGSSIALLASSGRKATAGNLPVRQRQRVSPLGYRETEHISNYYRTTRN